MDEAYRAFLERKRLVVPPAGITVPEERLHPALFGFQRESVAWALRRGRAALWHDTGLGKTLQQLEWSRHVCRHTGGRVLILAPLAVARQTEREGMKIDLGVTVCRTPADVSEGVNVTNYERLHLFDPDVFTGVVLDESSILKAFMGKTKRALVDSFAETPFRLTCTATPAPNDHLEIGNHSEFLGAMASNEMISRWFINDTMAAGSYRLKGHAEADFWRWVASWAAALSRPSDLGYDDAGFALPELRIRTEIVDVAPEGGKTLFGDASLNATTMHREMRRTAVQRAEAVAAIVAADPGTWLLWCHTNYEADALLKAVPDACDLRGSESLETKEAKLLGFSEGQIPILVTKPSLAGFGLNWQHCRRMAFTGLSWSYELFYQAIRRCWRFGQREAVEVHLVLTEAERPLLEAIQRKQADHEAMKAAMVGAMQETFRSENRGRGLRWSQGIAPMVLPQWLQEVPA